MHVLKFIVDQMQGTLRSVKLHMYDDFILVAILRKHHRTICHHGANILLNWTPVHSRVNLEHFKGAHLDRCETYIVKLTC